MLYVTTRSNRDVFTAQRALQDNRGPDGGLFLPFRMPAITPEEAESLLERPFNGCVAQTLNLLFRSDLSAVDVDFGIGRHPVRLHSLPHRIYAGELWHNPQWNYASILSGLSEKLKINPKLPGNWARIAVRIAVLFGLFSQLREGGVEEADVALVCGDFSGPISAIYARQWGLPVRNIICCCNENHSLWDLLCHGQIRTNTVSVQTAVPEADVALPEDLERLVQFCGGEKAVEHYLDCCRKGGTYTPPEALLHRMRDGLFVSVVSSQRLKSTIPNVFRSHGYLLSSAGALAYGGLLDYRAKTGLTGNAVVLLDRGPQGDLDFVARSLGVSGDEVLKILG